MPIEIKELHIKAIVADTRGKSGMDSELSKRDREKLKLEIIKECVQEITQILENKMER
jgi:hypothetical protein